MADASVSDFAALINQQISSRDDLTIYLAKLEVLVKIGTNCDLSGLEHGMVNEYFWVLTDYVNRAIKCNDDALDCLLRKTNL